MSDMRTGTPTSRREDRERQRRSQVRTRRTWIVVLASVAVLVLATTVAWTALRPLISSFTEDNDFAGPGTGEVTVVVPDGATGTAIGQVLKEAGVVKSVDAFVGATAKDTRAASIQPGEYTLREQMSAAGALEVLIDPTNRQVARVTIREGLRAADILPAIAAATSIPLADLEAVAKDPTGIGLPDEADGRLEGWLFPATYETSGSTTAVDLLGRMVRRTEQELTNLGVPRAEWEATIIEASLVEAERGNDEDAAKIARVLDNRIAQDMPLQLDATVNYALNRYKIAVSIAETKVDSPYNTYTRTGLPVGPICSPGRVAIQAVRNPAEGDWLYFVSVNPDSGETKFATTQEEFLLLKAELNKWLAANPGR